MSLSAMIFSSASSMLSAAHKYDSISAEILCLRIFFLKVAGLLKISLCNYVDVIDASYGTMHTNTEDQTLTSSKFSIIKFSFWKPATKKKLAPHTLIAM